MNDILFSLAPHPLAAPLAEGLGARLGAFDARIFPDGESYLRVTTPVAGRRCILLAELSQPNTKYLPLLFLLETLRELGARSVGLVAPYLPYMRQDRRFHDGEAITSRLFASALSRHVDWLVTVDPHLHRYRALDEIYSIPTAVVQGAPALAHWLGQQTELLLVGPDAESEQWLAEIARLSGHPYAIGTKQRRGDRAVDVVLPELASFRSRNVVIIDDVIASGETILQCIAALKRQQFSHIRCAAVHGIFADQSDARLLAAGLQALVTCNTLVHASNGIDVTHLLLAPVQRLLASASLG